MNPIALTIIPDKANPFALVVVSSASTGTTALEEIPSEFSDLELSLYCLILIGKSGRTYCNGV